MQAGSMHILAGGLTSSLDHDPDCKLVRRAVEKFKCLLPVYT